MYRWKDKVDIEEENGRICTGLVRQGTDNYSIPEIPRNLWSPKAH
jgi:hypothetical protein